MGKFIHQTVRLNTTITQAMRFFLVEKEVKKWLGDVKKIENKTGGCYNVILEHEDTKWMSDTKIIEKTFEQLIKLNFGVPTNLESGFEISTVEINFMPGTSKTEYCTEIHVIHKGLADNENGLNAKEFFNSFWKTRLNVLREYFNGDWVIEDRDLILSTLKGSL